VDHFGSIHSDDLRIADLLMLINRALQRVSGYFSGPSELSQEDAQIYWSFLVTARKELREYGVQA
jgi:hypothetical protein